MAATNMRSLRNNRWLVFVGGIWLQAFGGIGYLFGIISPLIKSSLGYNQKQISALGVAKDIGDSLGLIPGCLSHVFPYWALLLVGALLNSVGYGIIYLVVSHEINSLRFWIVCFLICLGTSGETYFTTVALVCSVKNFPKSRGPVVGMLKGFSALCGAIFAQIYASMFVGNEEKFILMVAVAPSVIAVSTMSVLRTVDGCKETYPFDETIFNFFYAVCLLLAAYLMLVVLLQDVLLKKLMSSTVNEILTVFLVIMLIFPFVFTVISTLRNMNDRTRTDEKGQNLDSCLLVRTEEITSETDDESLKDVNLRPECDRRGVPHQRADYLHAVAEGALRIKKRRGPRRGEDFTLTQALVKADFWLMVMSLIFASGTGLTIIDNLGQMSQSMGYKNSHVFVSLMSIWNFLGRIAGGYVSEILVRNHAFPRPVSMIVAEVAMAVGLIILAMSLAGSMYIGTMLIGLSHGVHWAPATVSEIFGLKHFATLYNFLTMTSPTGAFFFSSAVAGTMYDLEAQKQQKRYGGHGQECVGVSCFFAAYLIMAGVCIAASVSSLVLVYRTRVVYKSIYGRTMISGQDQAAKEGFLTE
ncbi:NUCLEAR FUSION DEFECTIVE 4 protein [Nymphaea thermarum]|nr:NUCLEAR FUSION DEFECTIVE 4 protein [Nymphaea thermarum]